MDNTTGYCDWENIDDGKVCCRLCKTIRPNARVRQCDKGGIAEPIAIPQCYYLGKPKLAILVDCQTCQGKVRVETKSYVCNHNSYSRCLPDYYPPDIEIWQEQPESSLYQLCQDCEFSTTKPASNTN